MFTTQPSITHSIIIIIFWHCSGFGHFNYFDSDASIIIAWEVNEHTKVPSAQRYQSTISHNLLHFPGKQHLHVLFILSQRQYLSCWVWGYQDYSSTTHRTVFKCAPCHLLHSSLCCYCEFFSLLFPVSQGDGYNSPGLAWNVNKQHKATTRKHNSGCVSLYFQFCQVFIYF